ncbi:MAG: thioredoxin-disulfide reductase [Deltaproteobacteria bacterium]|nr:thioredoxin-disulfide reductase [Deltaproteobacteria bacterium]
MDIVQAELAVVGGGPAGLSAGIYGCRAGLDTLIIEKGIPGGQITLTDEIENYPGLNETISGFELAERMRNQAERFGARFATDEITTLTAREGGFDIRGQQAYRAPAAILATGTSYNRLRIPGEAELTGKGVSYCATCDGPFFRDQTVAVIGGGDAAIQEALYLAKICRRVLVVHRRDQLRATKILQVRAGRNPKIEFVWRHIPVAIHGEEEVKGLEVKSVETDERRVLDVAGVFIFVGIRPNLFEIETRVRATKWGFILTDDRMATDEPGLWAAGDIREKPLRQVVTAVSDGATAAIEAERYLENMKSEGKT